MGVRVDPLRFYVSKFHLYLLYVLYLCLVFLIFTMSNIFYMSYFHDHASHYLLFLYLFLFFINVHSHLGSHFPTSLANGYYWVQKVLVLCCEMFDLCCPFDMCEFVSAQSCCLGHLGSSETWF